MNVGAPWLRWPDFFGDPKLPAQPSGVSHRALDVAIDCALFEKQNDFAARTLPRIAVLHAPRAFAEYRLATTAANLNRIVHAIPTFPRPGLPPGRRDTALAVVNEISPSVHPGRRRRRPCLTDSYRRSDPAHRRPMAVPRRQGNSEKTGTISLRGRWFCERYEKGEIQGNISSKSPVSYPGSWRGF